MMKVNKRFFAAVFTVLFTAMAFTACASQSGGEDLSQASDQKVLNIASGGELDNLSTIIMDSNNACAQKLVYETLVVYDNGEFNPCLAESWEWNNNKTELTLHLRQGVTFHDGEPFNAQAVKKNVEFWLGNPNMAFLKGISTIESVDAPDDSTVVLHYSAPYFAVLNDLSSPDVAGIISPNSIEPGNFTTLKSLIGTGPYKYGTFVKGEYTDFLRNEDYWGDAPYYEKIVAKYIPDAASRLKALQTGEVDLIFGSAMLTYDDYQQAVNLSGVKGRIAEANERTRNIVVNASGQLCSDLNVRKAIAMSIDKDEIAQGLTYGYENTAERLFPEGTPHTDCEMNNTWSYDPERAKALLDEAGWLVNSASGIREKDGRPLRLVFTYQEEVEINSDIATAIKSQLAEVGIDVTVSGMEQMLWWQTDMSGQFDLTIWNTNAVATVPQTYFTPWLDSSAGFAAAAKLPEKAKLEAAIHESLITADEKRINEIFGYLINLSNDQVIDIPLTYTKEPIVYNGDKISDYQFFGYSEFFDISGLQPAS